MNRPRFIAVLLLVLLCAIAGVDRTYAQGETLTLVSEMDPPMAANTWTQYTIPLTAETFGTDAKAFQYLLSNVTLFRIRTEFHDGDDVGAIDEVRIGTVYASDFNIGLEGWSASGSGTMEWIPADGVDGGYLQVSDWASGDFHYAVFPAAWSGNWTPLIGQNIEFYLKSDQPSYKTRIEISNAQVKRIIPSFDASEFLPGEVKNLRLALVPPPSEDTVINLLNSNNGCIKVPGDILYPADAEYVNLELSAPVTASNCQSIIEVQSADYGTTRITLNVGDINPSEFATIQGKVTDATTGLGVAGAVVTIGDISATTNESGDYVIENLPLSEGRADFYGTPRSGEAPLFVQFQDLSSVGYNYLEANVADYYPYSTFINLPGGQTTVFDISLSPRVSPGGLRIVLNWAETPLDLDLYLATPFIEGSQFVISWRSKGKATSPPFAKLDLDDIDGLGPETLTIYDFFTGTYYLYVHNYFGTPALTESRAQVQIYNSNGLVQTVQIPTEGQGEYWYIGDIDGTTRLLTLKNRLTDTVPGGGGTLTAAFKKKPRPASIEALARASDITSWEWDLDGDGFVDSNLKNPRYTYIQEGRYTVSLTVSDGHTSYTESKTDYITVFSTDTTPPGPVSDLSANPVSPTDIDLSWVNPTEVDYLGTVIMRRNDHFPASVGDGTYVYNSTGTGFRDSGLLPDTTYYYTAFAYDGRYNYSAAGPTSSDSATTFPLLRQGLKVNMALLDISGFGTVKAFATVVDSITFEPVTNLTNDNFKLYEEGVLESPISVEEVTSSSNAAADFVFTIDVTGVMDSYINILLQRFGNFVDSLDSKGYDYRLGLVAFDDTVRGAWGFTSDPSEFKNWLSGLGAIGGGDKPENALEGLARAASFDFRPYAQKITILVTDAIFHERDKPGDGTTLYTTGTMVDELNSKNIVCYVIGPDSLQMHQLSEGTGGLFFDINKNFASRFDIVGDIVSSQYLVSYDTHNAVVDDSWRQVLLEVREGIRFGSDQRRYFVAGPIDNVSGFDAYAISTSEVICRWVAPGDSLLASVIVSRSSSGFPSAPEQGTIVYSGSGSTFLDQGLEANTTYYYAAYAIDRSGLAAEYSKQAAGTARTFSQDGEQREWTRRRSGSTNTLVAVMSTDSGTVYIAGREGTFLKSSDAGDHWSRRTVAQGVRFNDLLFLDNAGGGLVGEAEAGLASVWGSDDGGATWSEFPPPSAQSVNGIDGVDDANIWTVTDQGGIFKLAPDGSGWLVQNSGVATDLLCVDFVNRSVGWAVGKEGVILKTVDGGRSWASQNRVTAADINSIHFQNQQLGWAVTSSGQVLKTLNGGNTWARSTIHSGSLNGVYFSDPFHGFAVGSRGAVYETSDGGTSWIAFKSLVAEELNDVYLITPYLGWIVGDNGTILKLAREKNYATLAGYKVNISSIDAETFPDLKAFVSVVDTSDNSPVQGLIKDNFMLAEETLNLPDFSVRESGPADGARADLVFVCDITAGMTDEIVLLKEKALSFANTLANKGVDYRFALVAFDDKVREVHDFTADVSEFKSWLQGLTTAGSGISKNNALEGLERSINLSWRAVSQRSAYLITDSDYYSDSDAGGGMTDQTTGSIIDSLLYHRIVLNAIGPDMPHFHQLANETGGLWFDIGDDFGSSINKIGTILSSPYVITFTSPNAFTDNSWRKLDVTVESGVSGGFDRTLYYISSARLFSDPAELIGTRDDVFTLNIYAENMLDLGMAHFFVKYDSNKLTFIEGAVGDFLKQGGGTVTSVPEVNDTTGTIEISLTRVAPSGASGTGILYSLKFHIMVDNSTSDIIIESADLRTKKGLALPVRVTGTAIKAANELPGGLVGDFDEELDIDLRDFSLLATYWKPANNPTGDIGPATGTVPTLTPAKDGVVNFEDLFVFTRMWNWFNQTRESFGGGLGKGFASLEWRLAETQPGDNTLRLELFANSVEHLSMGHFVVEFDNRALKFKTARPGRLITRGEAASAFLVENQNDRIEVSLARLAPRGSISSISGSGVIAVFKFDRRDGEATAAVKLAGADFRTSGNTPIAVNVLDELFIDSGNVPGRYALSQNFPNPFNSRTQLLFSLPQASRVRLTIMNVLGQPVRSLVNKDFSAGSHRIVWDGKDDNGQDVAGGTYLIRMEAGTFRQTREMLFLK